MYSPQKDLQTPQTFDFPYEPYDIQQNLMVNLYETLERKQIGIFESPTGTGKSLTLTCGAIRWLKDHQALVKQEIIQRIFDLEQQTSTKQDAGAVDWITAQYATIQQKNVLQDLRKVKQLLAERHKRVEELKLCREKKNKMKLKRSREKEAIDVPETETTDEVEREETVMLNDSDSTEQSNEQSESWQDVKIYFCSRTHTQLSQVVREIKRSSFGDSIRCISLASRQQLCINKQVRKLKNVNLINERCLEMARSDLNDKQAKTKKAINGGGAVITKCPYKAPSLVEHLMETALTNVLDIEDLVGEAESMKSCPYYASRKAVPMAEIVMLPYQMLLHRRTRLQNDIQLNGSIIIIDEAHNLLETLAQMHSCELSLQQLMLCQQQILTYKMRYGNMFSTTNLLNINQMLYIVRRLIKILNSSGNDQKKGVETLKPSYRIVCTYELAAEGDFFNIDLNKLIAFCERTHFARKLQTFHKRMQEQPQPNENAAPGSTSTAVKYLQNLEKLQQKPNKPLKLHDEIKVEEQKTTVQKIEETAPAPLRTLVKFLETLTEDAEAGRILINIDGIEQSMFKYMLMNPEIHFRDILDESRALIIAGGTMQPTNELKKQLFSSCLDRVKEYIYDHVVPQTAVQPFAIIQGPTGKKLCFNYSQRCNEDMLKNFAMILQNLCNVVPAGLVCFLPSYKYLDTVYDYLKRTNVLTIIEKKRKVLRESSSAGPLIDKLLSEYAEAVKTGSGALLLSVVGGKLSEGLNFSDDLGRGVIVVGLPYPNRTSAELVEKMKYLDESLGPGSGDEYYENLCMKAVNQCIGRSVRHIRDYACVFLLDERFALERIRCKLPQWISRNLQISSSFGQVQSTTVKFFKSRAEFTVKRN